MDALMHLLRIASLDGWAYAMAGPAMGAFVSAVWEGAALVGGVALLLRLMPGLSAAARSMVWVNVFLLLVLLHVYPLFAVTAAGGGAAQRAPLELGAGWCYALAVVWLALSVLRGAQLAFGAMRLRGLARRAKAVDGDPAWGPILQAGLLGGRIQRKAMVCVSAEVSRPSVIGFFDPRILIPPQLLERLSASDMERVLMHEMEHLRRCDDWTNLLQKMVLVLFPLNPALLWVERRLCAERELACDDSVLRATRGPKAYAVCLTHLAEYSLMRRGLLLMLGAWERRSEVARRVHRILRGPARPMNRRLSAACIGGLMAAVVACAVGLSRSPQLVGFRAPESLVAEAHPMRPAFAERRVESQGEMGHAVLLKAEMGQPSRAGAAGISARALRAATGGARLRRNVAAKKDGKAQQRQAWVVMTQWTETGSSQQLVWTVMRDRRASYAAIRTVNGWLLIQI